MEEVFLKTLARALFAIGLVMGFAATPVWAADVTVFAAASLSNALQDVGNAWQKKTGHTATFSFAASSVLAKQIQASAYADMFISADSESMDFLDSLGLVAHDTRSDLLGNHLVL